MPRLRPGGATRDTVLTQAERLLVMKALGGDPDRISALEAKVAELTAALRGVVGEVSVFIDAHADEPDEACALSVQTGEGQGIFLASFGDLRRAVALLPPDDD